MDNQKIRVAITHGDTNGIGYEQIFRTFQEPEMLDICTPIIYGAPKVAAFHLQSLNLQANLHIISSAEQAKPDALNLVTAVEHDVKVEFGNHSPQAGKAAITALDRAMADYKQGLFDVLVTAPVNATSIKESAQEFSDFTHQVDFIERSLTNEHPAMPILVNNLLRIGLATYRLPLKQVVQTLNKQLVKEKAKLLFNTLQRDFALSNPRIAILAFNPDFELQQPALEEKEILIPAIEELFTEGIKAFGPYSAQQFFTQEMHPRFDAVLALYHDQGFAPFQAYTYHSGTTFTAGLSLIHTQVNTGDERSANNHGEVSPQPLRDAIYLAIDTFRNRQQFDETHKNPLPKLYKEKKDESEKVRFSIPKKHEKTTQE